MVACHTVLLTPPNGEWGPLSHNSEDNPNSGDLLYPLRQSINFGRDTPCTISEQFLMVNRWSKTSLFNWLLCTQVSTKGMMQLVNVSSSYCLQGQSKAISKSLSLHVGTPLANDRT